MRVHHLNCGSERPIGGALVDGRSKGLFASLVCHCLLLETNAGLVLVDTGYGLNDVRDPYPRLSRTFGALMNIHFRERETAIRQVQALGYKPRDVRHIVLTHLDFDHAGGIQDFPEARIHVMAAELHTARIERRDFVANRRYRPLQWANVSNWRRYRTDGERWFGFRAARQLEGLPPEILLIPLRGHTRGHAGVAVDTGRGWLLHAGDAYFYRGEVRQQERDCTPGLRLCQNSMEVDRQSRLANQARLRKLSLDEAADVTVFCAHDASEFEACLRASREREAPTRRRTEAAPAPVGVTAPALRERPAPV
jgi:glyoxylase-like metal-dependent hydrolase (beta-lactamase superfamily II)